MSDLLPVSKEEKIACLKREIAMRERVYPGWVKQKKMSQTAADHQIRAMTAILHDYIGAHEPPT